MSTEKMRLCPHRRMWLVAGHVCNCAVLRIEWWKRRNCEWPHIGKGQ